MKKEIVFREPSQLEERLVSDPDFRQWWNGVDRHHVESLAPYIQESKMSLVEFVQAELEKEPGKRVTRVPEKALVRIEDTETKRLERLGNAALRRRAERNAKPRPPVVQGLPLTNFYITRRRILKSWIGVEKFLNEAQCELEQEHGPGRIYLISTYRTGGKDVRLIAIFRVQLDKEEVIRVDEEGRDNN